jgi:tetratricopeptide (TPR) repeat protein
LLSQQPTLVTVGHLVRSTRFRLVVLALALLSSPVLDRAQAQESAGTAVVHGYVRDSTHRPVANATVVLVHGILEQALAPPTETTHTDSEGRYRFATLTAGSYSLRAEMVGYDAATAGPGNLGQKETVEIDLFLASTKASKLLDTRPRTPAADRSTQAPEFFDEPQFAVAGVTETTNAGGHGSDTVRRTSDALAKATVSLSKDSAENHRVTASAETEASLRDTAARGPDNFEANDKLGAFLAASGKPTEALPYLQHASRLSPKNASTHHLLGDVEEKLANPLAAVREYQRAAELDPSELNLFDWGTELLHHRAFEPATEVLAKGNRLFPNSVRTLVALGVAWYSRGSYDQATLYLAKASDLGPGNPTPYLFLGRIQTVEATPSEDSVRKLARFAQLQPENALANYYYAVSLWKQSSDVGDSERPARVESLLQKAVHLDPNLGAAYLQLGMFYSQRDDLSRAILAYRKAIEVAPATDETLLDDTLEVAHYRLAQAYRRTGDETKAQQEFRLHDQCAEKTKEHVEHERRETQQFVIALRNQNSVTQPQP